MSIRFLNRASGTSGMQAFANDAEVRIDSADDKLKFYDKTAAAARSVVTENQTQTLTNKTLTAPVITGDLKPIATITGDGAITITSGIVVLTKGSAAAITLAASAAGTLGTRMTIVAGSAFAHVVTATGLIDDGVTGGSKTTLTFGAFVGSSITLIAAQVGKWAVESKNVVVIT